MQCSVYIATSLDGYIARTDGGLDWLDRVQRPDEDHGYAAFAATVDTLVIGRRTYDTVLGFGAWPYAGKRVVVLTHRALAPAYGEEAYDGPVTDLAASLRGRGANRVYVDGGRVIQQFMAAGLVDDLTISIVPVVLGAGIPLFGGSEHALALVGARTFESGLVQLHYRS